MKLIIMRHGKAEDGNPEGDHARKLTPKGHRQAERQAQRLAKSGQLPNLILSSPLVRARETAETFAQAADISGPMIQTWLACGMSPETAVEELAAYKEFGSVCIGGHEPDLSSLVALLTGSSAGSIQMKKGSMAILSANPPSKRATLEVLLPAKSGL